MADSDSESDELPQLENAMQQLHHARAHGTHNAAFLEDVILNDVGLAAHVLLRFNATTPVVAITDEILLLWAQATSGGFTVYPRLADWWCDIDDRFEGSFPSIFFAMNPPDARACRFLLEDLLVVTLVAIEFESNRPISCAYRDHRLYTPLPPGGMNMYGSEGPMEVSMRLQKMLEERGVGTDVSVSRVKDAISAFVGPLHLVWSQSVTSPFLDPQIF